ncbi:MAG TPA: hypothetical protein VGM39_14210 [Kofleriaceae bacterium]|jgi:hypothetical protein
MAEDHEDDDLELGDLRSVFKSMRDADEEPPSGGMAALMAAARARADEMKPQPSLWERFFAAIRRPPVLAFATVVVLVGGGAVMMRHRSEMKESVNAPLPTATAKRDEAPPQEEPTPVMDTAPEAKNEMVVPPPTATATSTDRPITKPTPKAEKLTAKQRKELDDQIDRAANGAMLHIDVDELAGKKKGAVATQKTAGVTPPKKPATEAGPGAADPHDNEDAVGGLDDSRTITKESDVSRRPAMAGESMDAPPAMSGATLAARWKSAAGTKQCALANKYAAQLAAADRALYDRTYADTAAVRDCLAK